MQLVWICARGDAIVGIRSIKSCVHLVRHMRCHGYAEECVKIADLPLNKQLGHAPHANIYVSKFEKRGHFALYINNSYGSKTVHG